MEARRTSEIMEEWGSKKGRLEKRMWENRTHSIHSQEAKLVRGTMVCYQRVACFIYWFKQLKYSTNFKTRDWKVESWSIDFWFDIYPLVNELGLETCKVNKSNASKQASKQTKVVWPRWSPRWPRMKPEYGIFWSHKQHVHKITRTGRVSHSRVQTQARFLEFSILEYFSETLPTRKRLAANKNSKCRIDVPTTRRKPRSSHLKSLHREHSKTFGYLILIPILSFEYPR